MIRIIPRVPQTELRQDDPRSTSRPEGSQLKNQNINVNINTLDYSYSESGAYRIRPAGGHRYKSL
jgi:hypothetical protein